MTMSVQQNSSRHRSERQIEASCEFFECLTSGCDGTGFLLLLAPQERGRVFLYCRETARFTEEDFHALLCRRKQPLNNFRGVSLCVGQQSLGDKRAPATTGPHDRNPAAAFLQCFQGGDSNLGIVVVHEGVVEQHDSLSERSGL